MYMEEYTKNDLQDYPAWTFLLEDVIENYGFCPYLDPTTKDYQSRRVKWLSDTPDNGKMYTIIVSQNTRDLVNQLDNLKSQLKNMVLQKTLLSHIEHDSLVDQIKSRMEVKSMNKKFKSEWSECLIQLEALSNEHKFDFIRYTKVMYNVFIRHKCFVNNTSERSDMEEFIDNFQELDNEKNILENKIQNDTLHAKDRLANLIDRNFQIDQIGRYFKRWSSLSECKKDDRIKSYIEWFVREHSLPTETLPQMFEFIKDKFITRELKVSDIEWNSKLGIITNVKITWGDDPQVNKRNRVKTRQIKVTESPVAETKLSKLEMQRINRLLLFELCKSNTSNKGHVVEVVFGNVISTKKIERDLLFKYINSQFDELCLFIKNNPMTTT